ncbi:LacI family DNA-binding transcriptional regulator [Sneathiella sp. HT1-7]|uniref:LacI family DNA-binding transcriptional regulator n=1 Tax=Sneathiella sp. HT1-7 TaxID=2887192 RepID=UPI001D13A8A5|nr:LacI family DNA-binding transcriptional regulator [Sneathiella sp. HT1-7]MCC3306349.1 LacI family transcriptional regulator [Sneathiella sp. HT1-7]
MTQSYKMVTARDVAELADVSVSTVGRALADDPRISAKTISRVKEVASRLGYVGNLPARQMRGAKSNLIGLMLPDIRNYFYATIAEALSDCCSANGYQLALSIANDPETEARHVTELISARAAGIVIVPTAQPKRETRDLLNNFPHVQLLRRVDTYNSAWFGINDEESLCEGTKHLLNLGHRRIAYVGGSLELSTGNARRAGFRRAFAESGIEPDEAIEIFGPPSSAQFGANAVTELLNRPNPPTALITGTIRVTQAILEILHQMKISVPEDLSVVGFGDAPEFKWWGSGLTTLRMPIEDLATTCGLWFLHHIASERPTNQQHSSVATATLVVRGSTAPLSH